MENEKLISCALAAALFVCVGGCKNKTPAARDGEKAVQESPHEKQPPSDDNYGIKSARKHGKAKHFDELPAKSQGILSALSKGNRQAPPSDPQEALEYAMFNGDVEAVLEALDKGAEVNLEDEYGTPDIHTACKGKSLDVLKALVSKGADLEAEDSHHNSCMHEAAGNAPVEIVAYLLEQGADPDATNDDDITPLMRSLTAEPFSMDKVKLLIEKGADASGLGDGNETTLHLYYRSGCAKWDTSNCPTIEVVKLLVENGADVKVVNTWRETALHHAAGVHDLAVVQYLVSKGADVNAGNMDGWTPLDYAHQSPYDAADGKAIDESDPDRKAVIAFLTQKGGKSGK